MFLGSSIIAWEGILTIQSSTLFHSEGIDDIRSDDEDEDEKED